ncbi:hypothetical protein FA15DRAFT_704807 [Coprinopsis marcescibilis]|uniref:Uncharacterized protein n=1 Tax=Coprinopsis marcescibilis TaxID=230819 RepID=A0A5C3KUH2_COPMA|nr:hypothetical protein FA15DRAFT_704807 [Coprinopsis marcescibilis]
MPVGGSHSTFSQISGAPGFKLEEYVWDKGFSEGLERLRGVQRRASQLRKKRTTMRIASCLIWPEHGGDRSDDQSALIARMTNQHQAPAAHRTPLALPPPPPPPPPPHTTTESAPL